MIRKEIVKLLKILKLSTQLEVLLENREEVSKNKNLSVKTPLVMISLSTESLNMLIRSRLVSSFSEIVDDCMIVFAIVIFCGNLGNNTSGRISARLAGTYKNNI